MTVFCLKIVINYGNKNYISSSLSFFKIMFATKYLLNGIIDNSNGRKIQKIENMSKNTDNELGISTINALNLK